MMTPKKRILAVLRGDQADRIPFTIYENLFPRGDRERWLRNEGMALIRHHPVYRVDYPNVEFCRKEYLEGNEWMTRETLRTPVGEIWQTLRTWEGMRAMWRKDFYVKKPSDYKVMGFVIKDSVLSPDYEGFLQAEKEMEGDGIVVTWSERSPIQKMWIELMGPERFSIDLFEESQLFHSLYEVIRDKQKQLFEIVANSPAKVIKCGDNITADMIGYERFNRYCIPYYNEYSRQLHKKGKLFAVHMDGELNCLKEAIAKSEIDIIESFTPPPVGDLSLKEAYSLWQDKVIWMNFTTSMHLSSPEKIKTHTLGLLQQIVPGNRFLFGISEDIPYTVRNRSMTTITQILEKYGLLPLKF